VHLQGFASAERQWMGPLVSTTLQKSHIQLKVNFYHEIMEIGCLCSNLIEESHNSSNPGHHPAFIPRIKSRVPAGMDFEGLKPILELQ
jgi:hypothetical protein